MTTDSGQPNGGNSPSIFARWTRLVTDTALPRSSHSLCLIDDKAYIFGGEVQPRIPVDADVHIISLTPSHTTTSNPHSIIHNTSNGPAPRVGHTAVAIGRWMYVFGGRGGKNMKPLDENGAIWCLDTRDDSWTALTPAESSPVPAARSYHASAATSRSFLTTASGGDNVSPFGTVFVHAGCPAVGRLADVWAFDIASRQWTQLPDAPGKPRGGPALAYANGELYRFGGFDGMEQLGKQLDRLSLGVKLEEWQSVQFDQAGQGYPEGRSVAGMHHVRNEKGGDALVLCLGERNPSNKGHDGAGEFWSDVWTFPLRQGGEWQEVRSPEADQTNGQSGGPTARGWFASSSDFSSDRSRIVLWGGINEKNERLLDGYILTLDVEDAD